MDTVLLIVLLALSTIDFAVLVWFVRWVKTHLPPPSVAPRPQPKSQPRPAPVSTTRPTRPREIDTTSAPDGDIQVFYDKPHRVHEVVGARGFRIKTPQGAPKRFGPYTYVELVGINIIDYNVQGPRFDKASHQVKQDLAGRQVWLEEDVSITQDTVGNRLCAYVAVTGLCDDFGAYLIDRGLATPMFGTPYMRDRDYEIFQAQHLGRTRHA